MGHHCCSKQKVKRGLWSPEEDDRLATHITNHGHGSWSSVPKLAGLQRCGKSCRLRWINYLRPDLKRGSFTEEEERTIIEVHRILGNRWAQIAKHLPGRTDNEVKNFWNSCIKKKLLAQGFDPNTHNLLQKKSKSKTTNHASKTLNHHRRFPPNSSSLVFSSDDHQSPQNSYPNTNDNDTKLQNNTINFECNNTTNCTQIMHTNVAPIPIDDPVFNDVNLCDYPFDENSIWSATTSLEDFEQPMQTTRVIPTQEIIDIGGVANDYDLDASLFNMLSINYGFEDGFPASTTTMLPVAGGVYGGDDMGYAMNQFVCCEGNNFQCGSFSL